MCHVTGGGLLNFLRLSNYGVRITEPLPPQEIFSWIQSMAGIPVAEMYRTFNMGMGFAFIVPPEEVSYVVREVPDARVAGVITEERGVWLRNEAILPQE
jgi:phosphoribosylformylglycinamidine cyclo-ligase